MAETYPLNLSVYVPASIRDGVDRVAGMRGLSHEEAILVLIQMGLRRVDSERHAAAVAAELEGHSG